MSYCTLDDMKDSILKKLVTTDEIAEAEAYINDLAWSVGIDPIRIPKIEIPYKVHKLAIAYTLMTVAMNKSAMNTRAHDGEDAYELKRKIYVKQVDDLTREIKLNTDFLLGENKKKIGSYFRSIELVRR